MKLSDGFMPQVSALKFAFVPAELFEDHRNWPVAKLLSSHERCRRGSTEPGRWISGDKGQRDEVKTFSPRGGAGK